MLCLVKTVSGKDQGPLWCLLKPVFSAVQRGSLFGRLRVLERAQCFYCKKRVVANCHALHKENIAKSVTLVKTSCPVSEGAPVSCESELHFLWKGLCP